MENTEVQRLVAAKGLTAEKIEINPSSDSYIYITQGRTHTQIVIPPQELNHSGVDSALSNYRDRK